MGYTHYWKRPEQLDQTKFNLFAKDCKKIIDYCQNEMGIALADGSGNPSTLPLIDSKIILFNGSEAQPVGIWTTSDQISLAWPSDTASLNEIEADPTASKKDGHWFAGDLVSQRVAPINNTTGMGSGSYETFCIEQYQQRQDHQTDPLIFNFCKTSYRPYDLTVTAVLIAFKHHFFNQVQINTDGQEKDWMDGRILCNNILGYGLDLDIFSEPTDIPVLTPKPTHRETRKDYNSLSDICKEVKKTIQSDFKGVKISATKDRNSIYISVIESPEYLTEGREDYTGVNQYHLDHSNFTPYGEKLFKAILTIIHQYHWDESDSQSDYFHCAFYYNLHIGRYDNRLKIVQPDQAKEVKAEIEAGKVNILDYSEKAIAVIGETKPIKDTLKELGGKFNAFLKCGPGWIFPKTKQEQVKNALNLL